MSTKLNGKRTFKLQASLWRHTCSNVFVSDYVKCLAKKREQLVVVLNSLSALTISDTSSNGSADRLQGYLRV